MIVAFCLFKYFPYGGLQRDFLHIAEAVEARGHKIRVYVQEWQGERPLSFDIVEVLVTSKSNHGQGKQYFEWVQNHLKANPVDVVVGFNKMPGLDVYYAADTCYEEKVVQEKKGLKGFLYRLTSRYRHFASFEKATFAKGGKTKLLMMTEKRIEEFKKHYRTEDERFVLLPPGISLDRKYSSVPQGTRERFRRDNQIQPAQFLLLQVGSNFGLKGVDRSLKAIASLPENIREKVVFMVVGQDDPSKFINEGKKLGIADNVRFFTGRDDISEIMAAADIFIHPAYHENAGIVILEALASGLPVIVTETCGYSSYVKDANSGVVVPNPYSQDKLNDALARLLSDEELKAYYCANARYYADANDLYSMPEKAVDIILGY